MMWMGAESNGNCFQICPLFHEDFSPPPRYPGSKQSRQQANVKPTLRVGKQWSGGERLVGKVDTSWRRPEEDVDAYLQAGSPCVADHPTQSSPQADPLDYTLLLGSLKDQEENLIVVIRGHRGERRKDIPNNQQLFPLLQGHVTAQRVGYFKDGGRDGEGREIQTKSGGVAFTSTGWPVSRALCLSFDRGEGWESEGQPMNKY